MDVSIQKRLAAEIYGVGEDRVWIDPSKLDEVSKALTKEDIRALVERGVIKIKPIKGQSRFWARINHLQKKKGRRRGYGSRKGTKTARMNSKLLWILRIRAIRKLLRILKRKGLIDKKIYRKVYLMAKGGMFRSRSHVIYWLKENGYLKS